MEYVFYGHENADVPAQSKRYPGIGTPKDLYDILSGVWCAYTCAPRMRSEWSPENRTLGQCSITAFLAQDIFGGKVYGVPRPGGSFHCYNVVDGHVFDLTSEQFGEEKLSYENNPEQFREVHFAREEKRLRYEYLCRALRRACGVRPDYRYLFFDLDGTLTKSEYGIVDSVVYALGKFGINNEDREDLKKFIGPALFDSFRKFYDMEPEQADQAVVYYREAYESKGIYNAPLYDGVKEMLEELTKEGKTLFVVTAKPQEMAIKVLRHNGIDGYFAAVIGPDRKERHTDKAALVRRALRVLGGDRRTEGDHPDDYPGAGVKIAEHGAAAGAEDTIAEHALMVGDREYDAVGAAREGVDTIGVLYGYGSPEELRDAGAAYLARTPEEAAAIACGRDELAPGTARIAGTVRHSSVDGPGVRYVVFFQGCPHHCPECQNPETWDPAGGEEVLLEDLTEELRTTRYLDGVTLSGGDPFLQPEAAMAVADAGREMGLNVWAYTGWTFEALLDGAAGQKARELLGHLDVVVDGPFRRELLSKECLFRGSSNQRLIDVPASLAAGKAVEARL